MQEFSRRSRRIVLAGLAAVAAVAAVGVRAQDAFPSRPITLVVPYAAAGSSDVRARQVAQKLSAYFGQSVIVENKPGAAGNLGTNYIARAKPDGYTIGIGNLAPLSVNRALFPNLPFDPQKDLTYVALLERGPLLLVVRNASPIHSVKELVETSRAKGGKMSYASAGTGGSFHLAGEMFKDIANFQATHIPYKGGGPATTDLLAGTVDYMFEWITSAMPRLESKPPQMRALAITRLKRSPLLPQVPTFEELGYRNMEISNWFGIVAPKGLPPEVLAKLNQAVNRALNEPDLKQLIQSQGDEIGGGSPEMFQAFVAAESARWGKLVRDKHITAE
jgi:tripartite-type tricarboxylate transporter receptor subunit TctC